MQKVKNKKVVLIIKLVVMIGILFIVYQSTLYLMQHGGNALRGNFGIGIAPESMNTYLTEQEVQQYCHNNFNQGIKLVRRVDNDKFLVALKKNSQVEFEIFSHQFVTMAKTINDSFSKAIFNKALERSNLLYWNNGYDIIAIKIKSIDELETVSENISKFVKSINGLTEEDTSKVKYKVALDHNYADFYEDRLIELNSEELSKLDMKALKSRIIESYYYRELIIGYVGYEHEIESKSNRIYEEVEFYEKNNIKFKMIVKPQFDSNNNYAIEITSINDLPRLKVEMQDTLKQTHEKWYNEEGGGSKN
ncbi:MAG: hypothetical protein A2Y24_00230 [Clostridiales bacterium GWE2_32_10]|nr:MAG: hypothetical protein A2Y24_00230 [Clostridiales bacterium GWE2_32_10]HBY21344.1 hypothetical protein [Clostridiales bacterium]